MTLKQKKAAIRSWLRRQAEKKIRPQLIQYFIDDQMNYLKSPESIDAFYEELKAASELCHA